MRAIAIEEFGGRERLALMDLPKFDARQLAVRLEDVAPLEEGAQAHEHGT